MIAGTGKAYTAMTIWDLRQSVEEHISVKAYFIFMVLAILVLKLILHLLEKKKK